MFIKTIFIHNCTLLIELLLVKINWDKLKRVDADQKGLKK